MSGVEPYHDPAGFLTPEAVSGLSDRAVAHWNAGRFFEAHEDWETLWREAEGARREWLQGLIQFAAAFVHVTRYGAGGTASGFVKLVRSAARKAGEYAGDTSGIDFSRLWADLQPWIAHAERVASGGDLRTGAPAIPGIRHLPGHRPAPLPEGALVEDPDVDDAD